MHGLIKIEPISIPDLRKPTATPSLPGWLVSQRAALRKNIQKVGESFRDVMTLPGEMLPTDQQKATLNRHMDNLRSLLEQTPENDDTWASETFTTITKMMLTLGAPKATEMGTEAKAEAYSVAIEDVPSWAVVAVSRRWYRGDCGKDERGNPYDYRFMPDPATVRKLSISETFRVRNEISKNEKVVNAVAFIDCSAELKRGAEAMSGFWKTWPKGEQALRELTFEKAAELGKGA